MGIIGSYIPNDALSTFVAHINSDKHSVFGNFRAEVHAPEITTELSVYLPQNVHVDTIIVFLNSSTMNKLGDNGVSVVHLIFQGIVELVLFDVVWDDDKEEIDISLSTWGFLCLLLAGKVGNYCTLVVIINSSLKVLDLGF